MSHEVRYLKVELAKAKAETAYLRKKLQISNYHAKRIDKAYEDALLLAAWRASGINPSRSFAKRYGLSQNRWQNAVALLKMARVIQRHHHWTTEDLGLIEARLSRAKKDALQIPEAFFSRLPHHGRQ